MSGPQFFRLQSFSRKANPAGQSVEQVLGEAVREPEYSAHVEHPQAPRLRYGVLPDKVQVLHDEMLAKAQIAIKLKDGSIKQRGIRKDRHTLLTAIASHPLLTSQVRGSETARAEYEAWVARNIAFLKTLFGDCLVSVIEHGDEEHPHLHAFILPLGDKGCSARDLNPAWVAKARAEQAAKAEGVEPQTAVRLGNIAYRSEARKLQDRYYVDVGVPSALTRTGPKRERLSRAQWKARKAEARREAEVQASSEDRLRQLIIYETELAAQNRDMQDYLAKRLGELDDAAVGIDSAKQRLRVAESAAVDQARQLADERSKITALSRDVEKSLTEEKARLSEAQSAIARTRLAMQQTHEGLLLEVEQQRQRQLRDTLALVYDVIGGIFRGEVTFDDRHRPQFHDSALRERAESSGLVVALSKPLKKVADLWQRLQLRLTETERAAERQKSLDALCKNEITPRREFGSYEP